MSYRAERYLRTKSSSTPQKLVRNYGLILNQKHTIPLLLMSVSKNIWLVYLTWTTLLRFSRDMRNGPRKQPEEHLPPEGGTN